MIFWGALASINLTNCENHHSLYGTVSISTMDTVNPSIYPLFFFPFAFCHVYVHLFVLYVCSLTPEGPLTWSRPFPSHLLVHACSQRSVQWIAACRNSNARTHICLSKVEITTRIAGHQIRGSSSHSPSQNRWYFLLLDIILTIYLIQFFILNK